MTHRRPHSENRISIVIDVLNGNFASNQWMTNDATGALAHPPTPARFRMKVKIGGSNASAGERSAFTQHYDSSFACDVAFH
jgi:hypothetical protein